MQHTKPLRALLLFSGLTAMAIGASILFAPTQFHASYGITLGPDANLLSEVRAPGGALLVLGAMMLAGVFVKSFAFASTAIATAVYLAYGFARLFSIASDGLPGPGLLAATAFELIVGGMCALALLRCAGASRAASAPDRAGRAA